MGTGSGLRSTAAMRLRLRLRTLSPALLYSRQMRLWFASQGTFREHSSLSSLEEVHEMVLDATNIQPQSRSTAAGSADNKR